MYPNILTLFQTAYEAYVLDTAIRYHVTSKRAYTIPYYFPSFYSVLHLLAENRKSFIIFWVFFFFWLVIFKARNLYKNNRLQIYRKKTNMKEI